MNYKVSQDGKFIKPKVTFIAVRTDVLQNENLSLEAKGVFATICSFYQEGEEINREILYTMSSDEKEVTDKALEELKANGLLEDEFDI